LKNSRTPVYYRTYSGETLDHTALLRAVEKALKKSLSKTGLARPRMRIAAWIPDSAPLSGIVLAKTLLRLERKYGSTTIIVAADSLQDVVERQVDTEHVYMYDLETPASRIDVSDPIACWRVERSLAIKTARKAGAEILVSPLTRTDLNLLMLEAVLRGEPEALSEAMPLLPWTDPPVVAGFSEAEGELIAAVIARTRTLTGSSRCNPCFRDAKDLFYSVAGSRPELDFSSYKSLNLLAGKAREKYGVCVSCGGFTSPGSQTCRYCASAGLP